MRSTRNRSGNIADAGMHSIFLGETGTGKRRFAGDFRLERSIPRSPESGLQQRHSGQ